MTDMHLAQLNVARPRAAMDDPQMADFKAALEPINRLADTAPGFVWRLTDGFGADATTLRLTDGEIMVNLSVWDSRDALWNFAYRSPHMDYLRRRREWFHQLAEPYQVLWWGPAGHRPGRLHVPALLSPGNTRDVRAPAARHVRGRVFRTTAAEAQGASWLSAV